MWSLSKKTCLVAIGFGFFLSNADAANVTFTGSVTKIEARTTEYGGSDINLFFRVTSNTGGGAKNFRIVSGHQNEESTFSILLAARSMQAEINVFYDDSCSDYCTVKSLYF